MPAGACAVKAAATAAIGWRSSNNRCTSTAAAAPAYRSGSRTGRGTGAPSRRRVPAGRCSRDTIRPASMTASDRLLTGGPLLASTSPVPPGCTRGPLATGAATLPQAASDATAAKTTPALTGTLTTPPPAIS